MGKTKDLGHLAHIVAYDTENHITVPAGITMHTNQLVASQDWVTTALGSYALSSSLGSYVPASRTITINGTTYDLSDNRSWDITSMIYPDAGIPLSTGSAWGTSITNNSANWNTAYGWGNHASAGYLTSISSLDVVTALGYAPYNGTTNPAGYITGITSSNVTTALGYTPVTNARTITINGTAYDLSANREWTVTATETDTLATVTARGATTSTQTIFTSTSSDYSIIARNDGTGTSWRGRIGHFNATADRSIWLATYNGNAVVGVHNNALNAWADLYVNTVDGAGGGTVRLPSSTFINGSQAIHAGNIGSYTAGSVAWTGISAGRRTNYSLEFQPSVGDYAGFAFFGTNSSNAGYFLIRGGSDNDVYTENGITLVADQGWLTLAQRTTSGKGVRIMTGTSSSTRVSVTDSYTTISNTLMLSSLASNDGMIENNTGGYFHIGGWGVGRTAATAVLVNTAYWADNAGTADNSNAVGNVGISNIVRKDATSQYLKPYYEYGNYLNSEAPSTLASQMGGGGVRVDFASSSYTAHGDWGHIITFSGYNRYSMCQIQSNYYTTDHRLWYRQTNLHNDSWLGWKQFAFHGQDITFNALTGYDVYTNGGWFRNHSNNNGIYWSATGWHLMPFDGADFRMHSGNSGAVGLRMETNGSTRGYVYANSNNEIGFLNSSRSWSFRVENGGRIVVHGPIARTAHAAGFLEGSYNNVGGNSANTNPIYTIGSSYNPSDSSLGNMYGIGYAHPNLWGSGKTGGWGMYVCSAGVIDVTLGGDGGSTSIWAKTDIVAYSDARVKENIEVIENALEKIQAIRGVTFTRNDVKDKRKRSAGVIAQEVLAVHPEVVSGTEEDMYSVAYGNFAGLFIEGFKEQQKRIDAQDKIIEQLKELIYGLTK